MLSRTPSLFLSLFVAVLILTGALSGRAASPSPQQDFLGSFHSPRLEILSGEGPQPQRTAGGLMDRLFDVLSQKPDFHRKSYSPVCRVENLEAEVLAKSEAASQVQALQGYLTRCRDEVETGKQGRVQNIFQILRLRFDDLPHPFMRRVNLHLPGGAKLHGLLALKGDLQKRPFVILRIGIFGNIEEFYAESFIFRQLFEQGPFNVLVLENPTGKRYVTNNPGFNLGGVVEGPQNMQIAKILRDPAEPLSKLVESVHLIGMSLAGHGVFHTAALDAHQDGPSLIQSYLTFCPVVRLKETLYDSMKPGFEGTFVDFWMARRTAHLRERVPELRDAGWGTWWRLQPFYWHRLLDFAAKTYPAIPELTQDLKMPYSPQTPFWEASEPWKWFQEVKAPIVVLATREDELVPVELNAQALVKEIYAKKNTENMSVAVLDQGYHCTLPVAYNWDFVSAFVNSSVLANTSRSYQERSKEIEVGRIVTPENFETAQTEVRVAWEAGAKNPVARVGLRSGEMATEVAVEIPRDELDFRFLNTEMTESERETGVAWLSRNLKTSFEVSQEAPGRSVLRLTWKKWSAGSNAVPVKTSGKGKHPL